MRSLTCYILLISLLATLDAAAETVSVVTRDNAIRSESRFFAPVRAKVRFGDRLTVTGRKGDWYQVSAKGVSGWVHKSAVESRSYSVSGRGRSAGGVSADEVSLAGKGFNPQVEAGYRNANKNLNYGTVDEIERLAVGEKNLETFIRQGGLIQP